MAALLQQIAVCVQKGKLSRQTPFPADMQGLPGVQELVQQALDENLPVPQIIADGLIAGMDAVGVLFKANAIFIPEVMIAAKAMHGGLTLLKPYLEANPASSRGTVIIASVQGDLHDIGKNILGMFIRGSGWQVIDLGVNVSAGKLCTAVTENNPKAVCLSALLTTTMMQMVPMIEQVKAVNPNVKMLIGGAPVSYSFAQQAGADFYSPDPQEAVVYLNSL